MKEHEKQNAELYAKASMLIGLTGYAGCGKSTLAEYLVKSYDFNEISFADPIKNGLCSIFSVDRETLEIYKSNNVDIPGTHRTMRFLAQTLGTEWGRHIVNDNIWVNLAENGIRRLQRQDKNAKIVISDVRFPNEAAMIKNNNGIVVFIDSEGAHKKSRLLDKDSNHESESYVEKLRNESDFTIQNNGTIAELLSSVDMMLEAILVCESVRV